MKGKKESYFWTSYSDLMTSLFFVILVLFVLSLVVVRKGNTQLLHAQKKLEVALQELKSSYETTKEQLDKIQMLNNSIEKIDSNFFEYDNTFKRHTLKNIHVSFKVQSDNINDLTTEDLDNLFKAGKAIRSFMLKAKSDIPEAEYLLIVEGQSSKDGYKKNDELSYRRALSLVNYWTSKGIRFDDLPCEVIISGSGERSSFRLQPDNPKNAGNQRFVIHVIPKPGIIVDTKNM